MTAGRRLGPFAALALAVSLAATATEPLDLQALLADAPPPVQQVLAAPERHRVQVLYTQIDRRPDGGTPILRTFAYRAGAEYFYPASTVKLPVALLALEQLDEWPQIDARTPMITGDAGPRLVGAMSDPTAPNGAPTVAHYVRKILLVSDNDAYNRLYELLGQDHINQALRARDYQGVRIVHRLSVALSPAENRLANPIVFGDALRALPARRATGTWTAPEPILLGEAEMIDGTRVPAPKDFATKNALPLQALHDMLQALLLPNTVAPARRFRLNAEDLALVRRAMAIVPRESGIEAYADVADDWVKFLLPSGDPARPGLRVFNKVGDAYGFLTDAAYVVDFDHDVEFLLAATVYVNANATFNDDRYEYDTLGFPFLRALGEAVYALERARARRVGADHTALRALFVDDPPRATP